MIASDTPHEIKRLVAGALLEFTPSDSCLPRTCWHGCRACLEVQTYGDKLHVFVDDPPCAARRSKPRWPPRDCHEGMREIEVRMEEAFISLVRQQANAERKIIPRLRNPSEDQ